MQKAESSLSWYDICCKKPQDGEKMILFSSCPGCNKMFSKKYDNIETIMIWEYLADSDFPFPDYKGKKMSIHDPCNVRKSPNVHNAVRKILKRMNIELIDSERNREKAICCGASGYGKLPIGEIEAKATERAKDFDCNDVVAYCTSCTFLLGNVGKKTHHLIDLIFEEESAQIPLTEWREKKAGYTS
jgi:Fe-S oxidoreductase